MRMMLVSDDTRRRAAVAAVVAVLALGTACRGGESLSSASTTGVIGASPSSSSPAGTSAPDTTSSPAGSSPAAASPTTTSSPTGTSRQRVPVAGFGEVAFTVTPAGAGPAARYCALLAENDQQRARGLMGRWDLSGYDAMVFRFESDSTSAFYMRNVPVALSIAWIAADGRFVSATDMAPCPDREGCPLYGPAGPYRLAVEVLQGGLARLGVADGSKLTVGGACRA